MTRIEKFFTCLVIVLFCNISDEAIAQVSASVFGNTLYITGPVGEDMATAIRQQNMRGIKSIAITSHGGSVGYGMSISHFVSQSNLAVIVTDYCESACTLILAGARTRIGFRNASFLIHGAADGKTASTDITRDVVTDTVRLCNETMKSLYTSRGIDPSFVEWAVQTPRAGHERILNAVEALKIGLLTNLY